MATSLLVADPEDHAYVYFDTVHTGIVFRPSPAEFFEASNDNTTTTRVPLYEVVFTMDDRTAPYASWHFRQGITPETWAASSSSSSSSSPGAPYPEYRIGDLWTPHPDPAKAAYVWKFIGRVDDTFTLSSASNIHPGPIERAIGAHPQIKGVLVVGDQRRQPAALIELTTSPAAPTSSTSNEDEGEEEERMERLADEIFETVVQPANANVPAHATIRRTHMALVPAGNFVRTPGLGKIVRKKTVARNAALIEAMYQEHGDQWQAKQGRFNSITATTEIKVEVSESTA